MGGVAQVVRNYNVIAPRIDDIIAKRAADPRGIRSGRRSRRRSPPRSSSHAQHLRHSRARGLQYQLPLRLRLQRRPLDRLGGDMEAAVSGAGRLPARLDDPVDPTFNPNGGPLTDSELGLWDPAKSPNWVKRELRKLDLTGQLERPVIIMHGTFDTTVSTVRRGLQEAGREGLGRRGAEKVLAVYYIPGMGHGGTQYNDLVASRSTRWKRGSTITRATGAAARPPRR